MTAASIARTLDGRREGRAWRCRCPLHGGHSLVLRDGDGGRLLATCWGGCDRLDVLAELGRTGLLDRRSDYVRPAMPEPAKHPGDDEAGRIARARQIWEGARNAVGSPVARYLASRAITLPPPPTLRWTPNCWHAEAHRELPAMVGLVEHAERGFVGIHRTYLRADGSGKAELLKDQQKRTLGPIRGGEVRLGAFRPGEWLAVAEGIETTLAVMSACGVPGWAALSAGGIVSLILPFEATHVIICADHDGHGVGQRAADDAAARWLAEGRRVRVALPPEPGTDFNDLLTAEAATAEARRVA